MIVIRRLVDRRRAYTGIFLPGEPAKIFPTSDAEHARILAIYKQERLHEGIINDFSDYALGSDHLPPAFVRTPRPETAVADTVTSTVPPAGQSANTPSPSSVWLAVPSQK